MRKDSCSICLSTFEQEDIMFSCQQTMRRLRHCLCLECFLVIVSFMTFLMRTEFVRFAQPVGVHMAALTGLDTVGK